MSPERWHLSFAYRPRTWRALTAIATLAGLGACSAQLPSEKPLGSGPLAGGYARPASLAGADAGAPLAEKPPEEPPAPPKVSPKAPPADAGAHAELTADAGAGDGAAPPTASAVVFAGEYAGSDRATVNMADQAPQTQNDPKARVKIKDGARGHIAIALIDSKNGSTICTLDAKVTNDKAEVTPGQACFGDGPEVHSNVKRGTASLAGTRLTLDLFIELSVEAEGERLSGSIDYHFEGTR